MISPNPSPMTRQWWITTLPKVQVFLLDHDRGAKFNIEFYQDDGLEYGAVPENFPDEAKLPDEAHDALPQDLDQELPLNDHIDDLNQHEALYVEPDIQPDLDRINLEGDGAQPQTMGWSDDDLDELHRMARLQDAQDAMAFITAL
jgi:hypothetical protein